MKKNLLKRPDLSGYRESFVYLKIEQDKAHVYNLVQNIIKHPNKIALSWLKKHKHIAIPCSESMKDSAIKRFTNIVNQKGLLPVYGACIKENKNSFSMIYPTRFINFSPITVHDYEVVFGPWNWVIVPQSCQLIIFQVELGWHVVAGEQEAVKKVIDKSIKQAEKEFYQHAQYYLHNYDGGFFAYLATQLLDTFEYYQAVNKSILGNFN